MYHYLNGETYTTIAKKLGKHNGLTQYEEAYIETFRAQFAPQPEFRARYLFIIEGRKKPLFLEVNEGELTIHYGQEENIDVYAKLKTEVMENL